MRICPLQLPGSPRSGRRRNVDRHEDYLGIADQQGGSVTYQKTDISGASPESTVDDRIGYVPQTGNVFPTLTVEENVRFGAYVLDGMPTDRKREVYERFPALADRTSEQAGSLSGGQQQMLAIGCSLMLDPDSLLLDEPSAGLAPVSPR